MKQALFITFMVYFVMGELALIGHWVLNGSGKKSLLFAFCWPYELVKYVLSIGKGCK